MMKRFWTGALCCLLAAMLPLCALAQNPARVFLEEGFASGKTVEATFSVEPGEGFDGDAALRDLMNAIQLRASIRNDGLGAFTLIVNALNDNGVPTGVRDEVLTAALRLGEDGLYLSTEALGEQPVYVSAEDAQSYLTQAMEQMSAASATQFASLLTPKQDAAIGLDLTDEELRARLTLAFDGDEKLADIALDLKARAIVTEGEFTGDDHDSAVQKYVLTLTQEDIKSIVGTDFFRNRLQKSLSSAGRSDEEAEATIARMNETLAKSEISVPVTVLLDAESKLVSATVDFNGHMADIDWEEIEYDDVAATMRYARKTGDEGVTYDLRADVGEKVDGRDEPQGQMLLSGFHGNDGSRSGKLAINEYDDGAYTPEITADLDYRWEGKQATGELLVTDEDHNEVRLALTQNVGETVLENMLSIYTGNPSVKASSAESKLLLKLRLDIALTDGTAAMESLAKATPDTSAQIARMSSEELQAYVLSVQSSAIQALAQVFSKLPKSLGAGLTQLMTAGQ